MLPIILSWDLNYTISKSLCNQGKNMSNLKKIMSTGAVITALFAAPITVINQPTPALSQTTANNVTGTWQIMKGDDGLALTNPYYLRINHNTTSNVITGRIYDTNTVYGQCIKGFYLPSSRRLSFVRTKTVDCTSAIIQYWEGWVYPGGQTLNVTNHVWDYSGSTFSLPDTGLDFPVSAKKVSETSSL
jgi:hypothetical protein